MVSIVNGRKRSGEVRRCLICEKDFFARVDSEGKYCSLVCAGKGKTLTKKLFHKTCPTCNKEYTGIKSCRKYCSIHCALVGKPSWNKGKKLSEEHIKKLSVSHMGQPGYWIGKNRPSPWNKGEKENRYNLLHYLVRKKRGRATICELCGTTRGKIEWANKSHEYKNDVKDFISLCCKCHKQYDKSFRGSIKRIFVDW